MERKIGEIFEFGGEWYQCIKGLNCLSCVFNGSENCDKILCSLDERTDSASVFFKKLEKVGESYDFQKRTFQTYKLHTMPFLSEDVELVAIPSKDNNTIEIEIKQIKEDMEEKKTNFVEEIETLCKRYNMSDGIRADFISEIKEIIKDKDKIHSLKPFNLEAAKEGKPVCTRDGRKARIICFDKKDSKPIVALIQPQIGNDIEVVMEYYKNGRVRFLDKEDENDLMMLLEKKEGWVNLYKSSVCSIWSTKEEAMKYRNKCNDYIDTIKISWEE